VNGDISYSFILFLGNHSIQQLGKLVSLGLAAMLLAVGKQADDGFLLNVLPSFKAVFVEEWALCELSGVGRGSIDCERRFEPLISW